MASCLKPSWRRLSTAAAQGPGSGGGAGSPSRTGRRPWGPVAMTAQGEPVCHPNARLVTSPLSGSPFDVTQSRLVSQSSLSFLIL